MKKARHLRSEEVMYLRMFRADAARDQRHRCAYCSEPMAQGAVTADHRLARKKGGGTSRENIVACCGPCNSAKGIMSSKAFLSQINRPSPKAHISFHLAHFRLRLWRRTWAACRRLNPEGCR